MRFVKEFTKGLYTENPLFRILLGFCPSLAVTTSVENGLGMGIALTWVLVCSNLIISLVRNIIPKKIRIPIFLVIIATFVTIVEMIMQAYQPALYKSLGIFVPLIVVNCIVLGRAEAFAQRENVVYSVMDGLGMGIGYTLSLILISSIREIAGNGTFYGFPVTPAQYQEQTVLLMILPPGAFLTLGFILGFLNWLDMRNKKEK